MPSTRRVLQAANKMTRLTLAALPEPRDRTAAPDATGAKRILAVKLVGMGDAVIAASILEHLKRQRPDIEVGVLAGPTTHEVLKGCATVTAHHYDPAGSDKGLLGGARVVREIKRRHYDAAIDFEQHIVLIAGFVRLAGIPVRIGLAASGNPRRRFQTHSLPLGGEDSMWGAYVRLARAIEPSLAAPTAQPLPIDAETGCAVEAWWRGRGLQHRRVVALHLGSGSTAPARRWPVERFAALADRLVSAGEVDAVALTGTDAERPIMRQFAAAFGGLAVDAVGLGVLETAALLQRCTLVVSNDTGVMHLAAAMGAPTLGLFGPNSPARYAPVGTNAAGLYLTRVACSPCIQIHEGRVPDCTHPEKGRCLLDIDVDSAVTISIALMRGDSRSEPAADRREAAR